MHIHRLWLTVGGSAAAIALALTAGCSSSGGAVGPGAAAESAGSTGAGGEQSAGQPSASQSSRAADGPATLPASDSPAQRAAEAIQGPAAVPTAAQLAALSAQSAEIAKLSPAQMAGQRVIYSYNGLSVPASLLTLIRHGEVGGVIFFGANISGQAQLQGVIEQLEHANAATTNPARAYPLMLMADQEGGLVRRLSWAGPDQSEAEIGASASPVTAAAAAGAQAAAGLRAVGMNVNLAPVLDVYRRPGDFDDQYQRSYSMDPSIVSAAGAAFVTAQQAGGVAATLKHFPGLGDASAAQDTDNRPVRINLSARTLRDVDELPYQAAIKAGARLTMVSWANYPALDPKLPAGLSPTIIQGELQQRLGFTGVTITDALGAGALRAYGSLQNRTMLAGRAGMDALLCTGVAPVPGWRCVKGLRDGYTDGALSKTAFKAQLAQLLQLRKSLPA
ncbi:MAG TPA: glycoside hydrolase family 3 N-terminal domain-containing protein [Streptosporangiaceae bacterium]|nr:glycoside hydrolase family 3 N-terminal domain-containing protein [Streptosporangiaceae bacterium]